MNGKPAITLPLLAALAGCGAPLAPGSDPQAPQPGSNKTAASTVVICPDGSSYDPGRNVCVATSSVSAQTPPKGTKKDAGAEGPEASVRVKCSFSNGWVAIVPQSAYPEDDGFLMQALIGFTQEPDFWSNQTEYESLEGFAARRCTREGQRFTVPAGRHYVVVGEADTFSRRGTYDKNGYRRLVRLTAGQNMDVALRESDLTHTWHCISCPWVAFYDAQQERYLPAFVVLAHRSSRNKRGTDQVLVENVPVDHGRIKLRVVEVESEVTRLDQLVLEVDGVRVLPQRGGANSALAAADDTDVEMGQGTQVVVTYDVPHVKGTTATVRVIAHGHYEPVGLGM